MANTDSKKVMQGTVTASKKDSTLVTVVGTEKSKHMVTGKEYKVTKTLSENLIKTGHATLKK